MHAGEVLAGTGLVNAGLFYRQARVGGVSPPGDVAPSEGQNDRWFRAFFFEVDANIRLAQGLGDLGYLLKLLGVVEEIYAGPEAVCRPGYTPPHLVLQVHLGSHTLDRGR